MFRPGHILARTLLECAFLLICGAVMGGRIHGNYPPSKGDVFRLNNPKDPIINKNTVCGNIRGLTRKQLDICAKQPRAVAAAIQGMQVALHECQHQFRNHKWNCSSLQTSGSIPHTSPFLSRGFRETAFSYAIASAGVAHMVAQACHLGKIEDCKCTGKFNEEALLTAGQRKDFERVNAAKRQFQLEGCDFDIEFAMQFSVAFLDMRESAEDQHALIAKHNNRAGRLKVANKMKKTCKCHGTSGSCSLKTCWKETTPFRQIGAELKKLYENAHKIPISNSISPHLVMDTGAQVNQLVYFEDSPLFCEPDKRINFPGTKGRHCNQTAPADAPDSCETLCCGRHYDTHLIKDVKKCNCKFHWCCYVDCMECLDTKVVAVCR